MMATCCSPSINSGLCAIRYDPYERKLTTETYDQTGMRAARRAAVEAAVPARRWGLVLGTLGRQARSLHPNYCAPEAAEILTPHPSWEVKPCNRPERTLYFVHTVAML